MAAKVKNENYVTIQGFMINELGLSGNELIAYAVIYGFSQADGQYMTCSQEYIGNWCNLSRESTNRLLKRLVEKGLVIKRLAVTKGSMKMYDYKATSTITSDETSRVKQNNQNSSTSDKTSHTTSDKTSRGASVKTSHGTSDKSTHHKKQDNYIPYNKNKFNNFQQRNYTKEDFQNMERLLLNRSY